MAIGSYKKSQLERGTGFPLGAYVLDKNRVQFSISLLDDYDCKLHICLDEGGEWVVPVTEEFCIGKIFSVIVNVSDYHKISYFYEDCGKRVVDPYAKQVVGKEKWGELPNKEEICYRVQEENQDIGNLTRGRIAFRDLIMYRLHVRGFTKDKSSEVKAKGTFAGVVEKIPYLKELGINGVELMPCYDFDEISSYTCTRDYPISSSITRAFLNEEVDYKLNYWGYSDNSYYFAPKASYCAEPTRSCEEFKTMIDEFHKNGIEVYMEFHFGFNTNQSLIIDCLHFWQNNYGIDGFRVNKEWIPDKLLATDPMLNQTKLFSTSWKVEEYYPDGNIPKLKHLADYNDDFMIHARRFLKGDEEQVLAFSNCFKCNPSGKVVINYLANTNSFTLMDMVSYDVKHNEENGENGQDGTDYNFSWNCGVEGKTRRKAVLELRKKQIKNALLLLYLSQGIPLIEAGDEFGNSQSGNNNPYCLDNQVTWLNWEDKKKNSWLLEFVMQCIEFRKQHKVFHMEEQLRGMDYISCGCPDISFHGLKTWYPDYTNYSRVLGIFLCGKYAKLNHFEHDKDFYLACNFHWEEHEFCLPNPLKGEKWRLLVDTSKDDVDNLEKENNYIEERSYMVAPRTIVVFMEA